MIKRLQRPTTTKIVYTDASAQGYGGYLVKRLGNVIARGTFSRIESATSSTFRELLAVKYTVLSLRDELANQAVSVNVDNFGTSRILAIGSKKPHLQSLAKDILRYCIQRNIKLIPEWVPREKNKLADYISKMSDTDNWSIDDNTFLRINNRFGPFTVDRFATFENTRLQRFNSRFHSPNTEAVNCFTEDWKGDNNWLCPPVSLIGSTIRHLNQCNGSGTLLVPIWPSAYFWPILYPDGVNMAHFVKDFMTVHPFYKSTGNNRVFVGRTKFHSLALQCNFSVT